jgi:hypothetical protein
MVDIIPDTTQKIKDWAARTHLTTSALEW